MKYAIIAYLFIWSLQSFGQSIITDRPDQTESSSCVTAGSLQLESGVLISKNGGVSRQILAPTNLFRYGITNTIELRFLNEYALRKNSVFDEQLNGMNDIQVGVKIHLPLPEESDLDLAFLSHAVFPSGSFGFSNEEHGLLSRILMAYSINENTSLGANLGYNNYGIGEGDLVYTLSLAVGVNEKVGVFIEPYGQIVDLELHEMSFDAGFTYLFNQKIQGDFSFGSGINYEMNFISLGCSFLFSKSE